MMKIHNTENRTEKPDPVEGDFANRTLKSGLYIIATPIGNLRDITLRAIDTLKAVDLVLCEDTRVTRKLLSAHQIKAKTQSYHDHTENALKDKIIGWLKEGQKIALVSDAGMPLISDPGYKLICACREEGVYVTTLPGANAPLSALQLSGLPSDAFSFLGFFPNKTKARQDLLKQWMGVPSTLMAFETAPRLSAALQDIQTIMGERQIAVVREITKMFEETRKGTAAELTAYYEAKGLPKGEIVIVIAPPPEQSFSKEDIEKKLRTALKTMKTKEAAAHVAGLTDVPKSELYDLALEIAKNAKGK